LSPARSSAAASRRSSRLLLERLADLGVPMIAWANVGHGGYFQTFPIGIAAELDADSATVRLLDPPLVPAGLG
jgi:muramoyltetrapeptide carboxypeptidase